MSGQNSDRFKDSAPLSMPPRTLDLRIVISAAICVLTATLLNHFGLKFPVGQMQLEVIQKMTAAISCLLCVQDTPAASRQAGRTRLIITAIGGGCGVLAVLIDTAAGNEWLMVLWTAAGILLTLALCRAAKVPYVSARIGGVTFILVACTLSGPARIWYAVFRWISTLYGVLVVMLVSLVWERMFQRTADPVK